MILIHIKNQLAKTENLKFKMGNTTTATNSSQQQQQQYAEQKQNLNTYSHSSSQQQQQGYVQQQQVQVQQQQQQSYTSSVTSQDGVIDFGDRVVISYNFWKDNVDMLERSKQQQLGVLLFAKLFKKQPLCRKLFADSDISKQSLRLLDMFGWLLRSLVKEKNQMRRHTLKSLGDRHIKYGIKIEFFRPMLDALSDSLQDWFGTNYNTATRVALTTLFQSACNEMMKQSGQTLPFSITDININNQNQNDVIDMTQLLGKYWLRYICLLLPTFDKFKLLRVCKTFYLYLTLEENGCDSPEPPLYEENVYLEYKSMQLLVDDININPKQNMVSNSVTDIYIQNNLGDIINENNEFEFKERILNENEELLWDELCKLEAMGKYLDNNIYSGRTNISEKMRNTIGNININMKLKEFKNINIITPPRVLWIFANEKQKLDLETRKLICKSDEKLFYELIASNNNLYIENIGKINLYNGGFNECNKFELNIIFYFLKYQNKLIELFEKNGDEIYDNNGNTVDDFYLVLNNLLLFDLSTNNIGINNNILWINSIISSKYNNLISLELTNCNLTDLDLHLFCESISCQRVTHSSLQILSFADNIGITDAYMDELFEILGNYLGNIVCLILYDTSISDETCLTILNFYKSQFSKNKIKNDIILNEINKSYESIEIFKKELLKIKKTNKINKTIWKHKNKSISSFMYSIANDYGLIHKYYPQTMGDINDEKLEKLYGEILKINNFIMSTESIIELFERKIQFDELEKENKLLLIPNIKKRSKLKQLRLHLNS
eukprot:160415_1